jgi:hypothetical protein
MPPADPPRQTSSPTALALDTVSESLHRARDALEAGDRARAAANLNDAAGSLHELGHPQEAAVSELASRATNLGSDADSARRLDSDIHHIAFRVDVDAEYLDVVWRDPAEAAAGPRLEHPDHPRYAGDPWESSAVGDEPLNAPRAATPIEAWRDATIARERDQRVVALARTNQARPAHQATRAAGPPTANDVRSSRGGGGRHTSAPTSARRRGHREPER